MDHTLRRYQRAFEESPYDIETAQRYIRLLENALGREIKYLESPHETDYHVMRYRPIPGEFTQRQLNTLRDEASYFGAAHGIDDTDEDNFIVFIPSILNELGYVARSRSRKRIKRTSNFLRVVRRAQQVGYKYILISIDPDLHISENYRRTLADRGLEGSLKEFRKEAEELAVFLETWRPERHPNSYSDEAIRQTPLYRYLILPKARTIGYSPNRALVVARERMLEDFEKRRYY